MFGSRKRNDEGIIQLSGLSELRDYLGKEAWSQEDIIRLDLYQAGEKEAVAKRIPHIFGLNYEMMPFAIEGNPLMLALITGEHSAAEQILNSIQKMSVKSLGSFVISSAFLGSSEEEIVYSLESLLYEVACQIPIPLRKTILSRLSEEATDLYEWNIGKARGLNDPRARKLFLADKKRYPGLFECSDALYVHDVSSLLFFLQAFPEAGETMRRRLLLSDRVMCQIRMDINNAVGENYKEDMMQIGQIVMLFQERREAYQELLIFLLALISLFRNARETGRYLPNIAQRCLDGEEEIWGYLKRIPFTEKDFLQLTGSYSSTTNYFRIEILYELAVRKLKRKMPLYISAGWYGGLDSFFQLYADYEAIDPRLPFGVSSNQISTEVRLFRLLENVSRIEYEQGAEEDENKKSEICRMVGDLITREAEKIKDVFIELLEKGFVPQYCLDSVISEAGQNEQCTYMRPLLILQKYHGLRGEEMRN